MISAVVEKENVIGDIIEIRDKKDINHLINSFRLKLGEQLRVVDGEYEYLTEIINLDKKNIDCKILEKKIDEYSLNIKIDAGIGMLKNDKMEMTIQKLSEIGINKLIPLKLARTIAKVDETKEKWNIIVKETLKQCQGVKGMEIDKPKTLKEIEYKKYDLLIVPYENEKNIKINHIIRNRENIKNILYIIGSEGGISIEEIEYLKKQGAEIISLGNRILRAETAAIVAGGLLANEF